ncbi:condensation domain-containing protein [Streptomyces sp. INA 01156]
MLRAVWFDAGPDTAGRLLLTVHHLAVDGVSWRILLPDLSAAWDAVRAQRTPRLPPSVPPSPPGDGSTDRPTCSLDRRSAAGTPSPPPAASRRPSRHRPRHRCSPACLPTPHRCERGPARRARPRRHRVAAPPRP